MKRLFVYICVIGFLLILYGCPKDNLLVDCNYEYSINIKNLKDTIKTTDTLWVENDFDSRFCLDNGNVKNGSAKECPYAMRFINDTLLFYEITVISYTTVMEKPLGKMCCTELREQNGRYKSKYGIVFPDTGTYSLSVNFYDRVGDFANIGLKPYFDAYYTMGSSGHNSSYLITVIE